MTASVIVGAVAVEDPWAEPGVESEVSALLLPQAAKPPIMQAVAASTAKGRAIRDRIQSS